nr:hypothetical protein [Pseudooceanicola endophyticus]
MRIDPCDPPRDAACSGGFRSDPHGTFERHPPHGFAGKATDPRDRTPNRPVAEHHQEISESRHDRAEVQRSGSVEQA